MRACLASAAHGTRLSLWHCFLCSSGRAVRIVRYKMVRCCLIPIQLGCASNTARVALLYQTSKHCITMRSAVSCSAWRCCRVHFVRLPEARCLLLCIAHDAAVRRSKESWTSSVALHLNPSGSQTPYFNVRSIFGATGLASCRGCHVHACFSRCRHTRPSSRIMRPALRSPSFPAPFAVHSDHHACFEPTVISVMLRSQHCQSSLRRCVSGARLFLVHWQLHQQLPARRST